MAMKKAEYNKAKAGIEARLAGIQLELEALAERYRDEAVPFVLHAEWNGLHDAEWTCQQELVGLDRAWRMRHWTAQDYALAELIWNNCD